MSDIDMNKLLTPESILATPGDLSRDLVKDFGSALMWRDIAYDLPAYRANPGNLCAWAEGWPAAVRLAFTARKEADQLREQIAALTAEPVMHFADGRQPTENERHLFNLLSWREAEARQLHTEIQGLRQIIEGLSDRVAAQSELLSKRAEKGD